MPVTGFYVPLYAFWHFDDFSWGNTRVVTGEDGKQIVTADIVPFDTATIPVKKWGDHERDLYEKNSDRSDSRASDYSGSMYGPVGGSVYAASVISGGVGMYPPTHLDPSVAPSGYAVSTVGGGMGYVGRMPSDEEILRELKRILATANLMTITKKQTRDELSAIFGVDLTPKKAVINQYIEEILQGRV
ncbi:DEK C terminal domain-containing protein [Zopfochytrium polystomum]|nr:DEK C terminal domain-containing protein [Zopfochytrium polystomum]